MNPCVLAVSSTGGHLDELLAIAPRFATEGERLMWVTAATAQSESLLHGQDVEWVQQVGARQGGRVLQGFPEAMQLIRKHRPRKVVSTGAALSVAYLAAARLQGIETHYVESATRLDGPSMTGRIAQALPGVVLHRQANSWRHSARRWRRIDSVFDTFEWQSCPTPDSQRILVILGTERFSFQRAVSAVADAVHQDADIVWQLGHTPRPARLPGEARPWFAFAELEQAARAADVVVTHCGVGAVLMALRAGKCPVVIPRTAAHDEHVDDHQTQLARVLGASGLGIAVDPGSGGIADSITRAAQRQVIRKHAPGTGVNFLPRNR